MAVPRAHSTSDTNLASTRSVGRTLCMDSHWCGVYYSRITITIVTWFAFELRVFRAFFLKWVWDSSGTFFHVRRRRRGWRQRRWWWQMQRLVLLSTAGVFIFSAHVFRLDHFDLSCQNFDGFQCRLQLCCVSR